MQIWHVCWVEREVVRVGAEKTNLINGDDNMTDMVDHIQTPLPMMISVDFMNAEVEMLHKYL